MRVLLATGSRDSEEGSTIALVVHSVVRSLDSTEDTQ